MPMPKEQFEKLTGWPHAEDRVAAFERGQEEFHSGVGDRPEAEDLAACYDAGYSYEEDRVRN